VASGGGEHAIRSHDVWFRGEKVRDANICLRALGSDYMACTAVRTPGREEDGLSFDLGPFQMLSIDDVLDLAESLV